MARLFVIATDNLMPASERDEDDTATLFWNADDGFGTLSTATFFTEFEAKIYDLPIADDQPIWVELPTLS